MATEEAGRVPEATSKFIVFRDPGAGYRWRLRSTASETLAASRTAFAEKVECEQEVRRVQAEKYPDANILDLTVRRYHQR